MNKAMKIVDNATRLPFTKFGLNKADYGAVGFEAGTYSMTTDRRTWRRVGIGRAFSS